MFLVDFSRRSRGAEIIDQADQLTARDWSLVLGELRLVNRWLGGNRAVLSALKPLVREVAQRHRGRAVSVVDFGCGSADIAEKLVLWARDERYPVRVVAVDRSPLVCQIAHYQTRSFPEITVLQGDVTTPPFGNATCDLIFCSAFLHHFTNEELIGMLGSLVSSARTAVVVSDLRRDPLAYFAIRLITMLFSRSRVVCHDGPLSVLRGFRKDELSCIFGTAKQIEFSLKRRWAFRYVLVIRPVEKQSD